MVSSSLSSTLPPVLSPNSPQFNFVYHMHFLGASTLSCVLQVAELCTGFDLPYRMVVHPQGDGVVCASPKGCRLFEWEDPESAEDHKLGLKMSEKVLGQLQNAELQLALVFSHDGSLLAAGGEDGKLMVFQWPSMDIILNEARAHSSLKDLAFSIDGKFLVSLGDSGPCRVWDLTSSVAVASLPEENDETFGFCRFSQCCDGTQVLCVTAFTGREASILTWNTSSWKRIGSKHVGRDAVSTFNVSANGKLLAVQIIAVPPHVTTDGDHYIFHPYLS